MTNLPILILGSNGQVGRSLKNILGVNAISCDRRQINLADLNNLKNTLIHKQIGAIFNAAAYTAVDQAEQDEELTMAVNAIAPQIIAEVCKEKNIPLIHYSTDYVFSGNKGRPWKEEDLIKPLSIYGKSKALGEENIKKVGWKYLIFRTSWVYNSEGNNFLNTMLKLGKEREMLRVVGDQIGAPTYARDLAKYTVTAYQKALEQEIFPSGIFHLCGNGVTSWHGFAEAIFELAKINNLPLKVKQVDNIKTTEYPTAAKRPLNSKLNCTKIKKHFGIEMPDWYISLKECIEEIGASNEGN